MPPPFFFSPAPWASAAAGTTTAEAATRAIRRRRLSMPPSSPHPVDAGFTTAAKPRRPDEPKLSNRVQDQFSAERSGSRLSSDDVHMVWPATEPEGSKGLHHHEQQDQN